MDPEDQRLLQIVQELAVQMNFSFNPRSVTWRDRMGVRKFPLDYIIILHRGLFAGTVQLSKDAMGKLTPEEWRPLLASGVAYYKNINMGMLRASLPMYAIILGIFPFALVASFRWLDTPQLALLRYLVLGLLFVLLGLGFALMLRGMKGLHFKADQRAARLVGKQPLVSSLMKMASLEQSISVGRRGRLRPSVEERINRLNSSSDRGL